MKSNLMHHIFILVTLTRPILTLSVSTSTTEQVFSTMKIIKTMLQNKTEDGFLTNYIYG